MEREEGMVKGEGLGETARGRSTSSSRVVAAVEVGVALRPGDGDVGDGAAVEEVLFVGLMPLHDGFGGFVHAAIFVIGGDVVPPGLDAAGETGEHPHLGFGGGFGGEAELGAAELVHGHAFGDEFVPAEEAVHEFSVEGIADGAALGAGLPFQSMMISERAASCWRSRKEVAWEETSLPSMPSQRRAVFTSAGVAGDAVVEVPLFDAAGVGSSRSTGGRRGSFQSCLVGRSLAENF